MSRIRVTRVAVFFLGVLTFAVVSWLLSTFFLVERPVRDGTIEDWGQVCFWQAEDGIYSSISPRGCYSSSCTRTKHQTGTAVVDLQNQKIQLAARFVLVKTSRFPLPCTGDCYGGGAVSMRVDDLIPNDYEVWFQDERVGEVKIFSGRPTPRQCFEKGESNEYRESP